MRIHAMRHCVRGLALVTACLALVAGAATYKWVDKDGKVHYSDSPVAGAEEVKLAPITEIPSTPVAEAPAPGAPDISPLDKPTEYSSMTITNPKGGETVRSAGAGVTFVVDLQPGLGGGDRIEFLLDGVVVGAHVEYLERGTHSLSARVVSPDGATKIAAAAVSFTMMQTIAPRPVAKPPKK